MTYGAGIPLFFIAAKSVRHSAASTASICGRQYFSRKAESAGRVSPDSLPFIRQEKPNIFSPCCSTNTCTPIFPGKSTGYPTASEERSRLTSPRIHRGDWYWASTYEKSS